MTLTIEARLVAGAVAFLLVWHPCLHAGDNWPQWRGTNRDGKALDEVVPVEWSETKNIVWKAAVPGRGQSDPTVVGPSVFLTTADEQQQSLLCFDRKTGEQSWQAVVHKGGFESEKHEKCSLAAPTVACDGERVFVTFLNRAAIYVTAFSMGGQQLWQHKVSDFNSKFGYGASPLLYKSYVIVASDNQGGGALTALDRKTGSVVWNTPRQATPSYSSPVVASVAGKQQLFLSGADRITSYEPDTGKRLWSCKGASIQTVNTMAFAGGLVYAAGGYPTKETLCIRADGSSEVVWREKGQISNVPSMLAHAGYLYHVTDEGIAICRDAATGSIKWKHRLGGTFSASPVLAGEHIYVSNESGQTFVFKPTPNAFELVAENQLGDEAFASPVVCAGRIYLRVAASSSDGRKETLYCIGAE
jgi:outer membrane protein assembly factor BamB